MDDPEDHPDDILAAALAAGQTYAKAGEKVGLSERSVQNRMSNPDFRDRVSALKGRAVARAVAVLTTNMSAAALVIAELMATAEEDRDRLAAAKELISLGLKARSQEELEKQVAELAERVEKLTAKPEKGKRRGE
jgi:hypothetical protein